MLHSLVRPSILRASRTVCAAVALTGLCLLAPAIAQAQEFLSIKGNTVNVRAKPTTKSDVAWELIKGYPVQVLERQDDWVKVKDFEGTLGWVHQPLTAADPHLLVKVKNANLRSGASIKHDIVTKLDKYDIVQTLEKSNGWFKVRTAEGAEGWLREDLAWGW